MNKVDSRIGQHVFVLGVAFLDAKHVADLIQFGFIAATNGIDDGVGKGLIDRDELCSETESDNRHVELLVGHGNTSFHLGQLEEKEPQRN